MKLYNTLTRKKDELNPIHDDWVGLYTCGPTVYNFAHIGNLRTYVFEDILERALRYNGYNVKRVMNITDVGHMTGDSDTGEDKLDKAAQAEKKSVQDIAKFYTDAFFADLEKLNILKPEIIAPASEYIEDQIAIIQELFKKDIAYETPTAVYFDVSKFKDYGKLSGQSLNQKMTGARGEVVVDGQKHNAADFALWFKLAGKFEHHLLHWPSPWGEGFPGWHIECSAISRHFLGQPFDIHTGGVDHIGTHHENEIAQSEAAFGVPLANIWVHGEHLLVNDAKMAKSENNFYTLADLEKKGYRPLVFRYLLLMVDYHTRANFTWESLDSAKNALDNLKSAFYDFTKQIAEPLPSQEEILKNKATGNPKGYDNAFLEAINDDLNTAQGLGIIHLLIDASDIRPKDKVELLKKWDSVLGLKISDAAYDPKAELEIQPKLQEYQQLRGNKQFIQSDALRAEIEALGYSVRDTENGSYIVKKFF